MGTVARMARVLPVLTVVGVIVVFWYGATIWLNAQWTRDQAARGGVEVSLGEVVAQSFNQERPVLPSPHQVAVELYQSTLGEELFGRRGIVQSGSLSNRSLIYAATSQSSRALRIPMSMAVTLRPNRGSQVHRTRALPTSKTRFPWTNLRQSKLDCKHVWPACHWEAMESRCRQTA